MVKKLVAAGADVNAKDNVGAYVGAGLGRIGRAGNLGLRVDLMYFGYGRNARGGYS